RRMDGHRLAGDDGRRGAERHRRRARGALGPRRGRAGPRGGARVSVTVSREVEVALERGRDHLLSLQHPDGWWKGELETNVTIDAEDIFLRHYLRLPDIAETTRRSAVWIRSKQRPDGSWATFFGGPADLSTTVEAYVAPRVAGHP